MAKGKDIQLARFISYVLRHVPSAANLSLDGNGWADVDQLIQGCVNAGYRLDRALLETIVKEDDKTRFSFDENHLRIRANQGHSVAVDLQFKNAIPPAVLYHGTAKRFMRSIEQNGLLKGSRQYVHLSADIKTAIKVGKRHGEPVVLCIDAEAMAKDGYVFYISENDVWLCEAVPTQYLKTEDL